MNYRYTARLAPTDGLPRHLTWVEVTWEEGVLRSRRQAMQRARELFAADTDYRGDSLVVVDVWEVTATKVAFADDRAATLDN